MVKNQALNCFSGKKIPCKIDSVCIHGDNESSLTTAKSIRNNLLENGLDLKPLNKMQKFILFPLHHLLSIPDPFLFGSLKGPSFLYLIAFEHKCKKVQIFL